MITIKTACPPEYRVHCRLSASPVKAPGHDATDILSCPADGSRRSIAGRSGAATCGRRLATSPAVSQRSDRTRLATRRAAAAAGPTARTAAPHRPPRSDQRHPLPVDHGMHLADAAARLPSVGHGLRVFPSLEPRRNAAADPGISPAARRRLGCLHANGSRMAAIGTHSFRATQRSRFRHKPPERRRREPRGRNRSPRATRWLRRGMHRSALSTIVGRGLTKAGKLATCGDSGPTLTVVPEITAKVHARSQKPNACLSIK